MKINKTQIEGVYIIDLELRGDERGFFTRNFCQRELAEAGIDFDIVQINRSFTKKAGTIRGMHFQKAPKQESKMFQCLRGAIYYVAADIRENSETFGKWVAQELSEENKKMIVVPKGCASGFQTLTDNCEVQYPVSEYYSPEFEGGVRFDDPAFNIKWPIPNPILSDKDKNWPLTTTPILYNVTQEVR